MCQASWRRRCRRVSSRGRPLPRVTSVASPPVAQAISRRPRPWPTPTCTSHPRFHPLAASHLPLAASHPHSTFNLHLAAPPTLTRAPSLAQAGGGGGGAAGPVIGIIVALAVVGGVVYWYTKVLYLLWPCLLWPYVLWLCLLWLCLLWLCLLWRHLLVHQDAGHGGGARL